MDLRALVSIEPTRSEEKKVLAHQQTKPTTMSSRPATVTMTVRQNGGKEEDKRTVSPAGLVILSNRFDALLEKGE